MGSQNLIKTETRECKDCTHSKKLINGWICEKHLMAIVPDMKVTYEDKTCWERNRKVITRFRTLFDAVEL